MSCPTRRAYHPEGRQAKSVIRQTDYEEPAALRKFSGCAVLFCKRPIGQSRGPAQRGLALFRFTFVRTKVNPGPGRGGPEGRGPLLACSEEKGSRPPGGKRITPSGPGRPQKGREAAAAGGLPGRNYGSFTGRSTVYTSSRCRRDRDRCGRLSGPGGAASSRCRRPGPR